MIIFKFIIFYGGAFCAFIATLFLWLFWRPKLMAEAVCDEEAGEIRCKLRATRTLAPNPIRLQGIWIPVEYMEAMGASPPPGFQEEYFDREAPDWPYDGATREVVIWNGRLEVPHGQVKEVVIPAKHPRAVSGTLRLVYEYTGFASVLITVGSTHVPLNGYKLKTAASA